MSGDTGGGCGFLQKECRGAGGLREGSLYLIPQLVLRLRMRDGKRLEDAGAPTSFVFSRIDGMITTKEIYLVTSMDIN